MYIFVDALLNLKYIFFMYGFFYLPGDGRYLLYMI